jgi:hypothetical protein
MASFNPVQPARAVSSRTRQARSLRRGGGGPPLRWARHDDGTGRLATSVPSGATQPSPARTRRDMACESEHFICLASVARREQPRPHPTPHVEWRRMLWERVTNPTCRLRRVQQPDICSAFMLDWTPDVHGGMSSSSRDDPRAGEEGNTTVEKEGKGILARRIGLPGLLAASIVMSLSTVVSVPAESPQPFLTPVSLLLDPTGSLASGFGKALTQVSTVNCSGSDPDCLGSVVVGAPDIGRPAFMNPNNGSDSPPKAHHGWSDLRCSARAAPRRDQGRPLIGAPGERGASLYRAPQEQPPLSVQSKPPTRCLRARPSDRRSQPPTDGPGRLPGEAGAAYLIDFGGGGEGRSSKTQSPNPTTGGRFSAAVAFSSDGLRASSAHPSRTVKRARLLFGT